NIRCRYYHMKLIWGIVSVSLLLCLASGDNCPAWSYSGTNGPEEWGNLCQEYKTCKDGKKQSPVDIPENVVHPSNINMGDISFWYGDSNLRVKNIGHTVEIHVSEGNSIIYP